MAQNQQNNQVVQQPSAQAVRDTRRVLQCLLPGLPPPAIEMACNTFFASTSLTQPRSQSGFNGGKEGSSRTTQRSPSGRYTIKRMDSGDFSQLSLTSPPAKSSSKKFADTNMLQFNMD